MQNDNTDKKRKVAIQVAYLGEGYFGSAYNRTNQSLATVDGTVIQALVDLELIPDDCMDEPKKCSFNAASRTDKSVSALGQTYSFKSKYHDGLKSLINTKLPDHIRVLDCMRTTKNFHAQLKTSHRTYTYMMPSFVLKRYTSILDPIKKKIHQAWQKEGVTYFDKQLELTENEQILPKDIEEFRDFRASENDIRVLDVILKKYVGTHQFHNFTSGMKKGQPEAIRIMKKVEVDRHYMPVIDGFQFIEVKIVGQSFMIHQIRKMIGLALAMVTGWADDTHFARAFSVPLEDVPRAPGEGLVLESVHFDAYNNWLEKLADPDVQAQQIDWSCPIKQGEITAFKEKYILPYIKRKMLDENVMLLWLEKLKFHDYTGAKARRQFNEIIKRKQLEIGKVKDDNDQDDDEIPTKKAKKQPLL